LFSVAKKTFYFWRFAKWMDGKTVCAVCHQFLFLRPHWNLPSKERERVSHFLLNWNASFINSLLVVKKAKISPQSPNTVRGHIREYSSIRIFFKMNWNNEISKINFRTKKIKTSRHFMYAKNNKYIFGFWPIIRFVYRKPNSVLHTRVGFTIQNNADKLNCCKSSY
jgi:hypothetical protein